MKLILTLFMAMTSLNISAHILPYPDNENHLQHKNEMGIAFSPPYFINEKLVSLSIHTHYIHNIRQTKLGIGFGYEKILLKPKHNTFVIVTSYRPFESLNFTLSPGVTFEINNYVPFFSLHAETTYEFELDQFHIGPALEFAYDPNDFHISLGIHVGFGF